MKIINVFIITFLFVFSILNIAFAATYTVTNTNDNPAAPVTNSLRWAMQQANNNIGSDLIDFKIPYSDQKYDSATKTWRIDIYDALPILTDDAGTMIDGLMGGQKPLIEIRVTNGGTYSGDRKIFAIINIKSSNNIIQGLILNNEPPVLAEYGIYVSYRVEDNIRFIYPYDNVIYKNYIGTNATGEFSYGEEVIWHNPKHYAVQRKGGISCEQSIGTRIIDNIINGFKGSRGGISLYGGHGPCYTMGSFAKIENNVITEEIIFSKIDFSEIINNKIGGTSRKFSIGILLVTCYEVFVGYNQIGRLDCTGGIVGNSGCGIFVSSIKRGFSAPGSTTHPGGGKLNIVENEIAFNEGAGIFVTSWFSYPPTQITISRNSIYQNKCSYSTKYRTYGTGYFASLDLAPHGITKNNSVPHTGPNLNKNYSLITNATTFATGDTFIKGTSDPGDIVELYKADSRYAKRHGQGKIFLGDVIADPAGNWDLVIVAGIVAGDYITTTATDSSGNTSEFSPNVQVAELTEIPGGKRR